MLFASNPQMILDKLLTTFTECGATTFHQNPEVPTKRSAPLVAQAIGSTVLAHAFFRLFFGKDDMVRACVRACHSMLTEAKVLHRYLCWCRSC